MNRRSQIRSHALGQPFSFFRRIDNAHCDRIHSSLTAVHSFDDGYVGKQPVHSLKRIFCRELVKGNPGSFNMDKCTDRCDITEILL